MKKPIVHKRYLKLYIETARQKVWAVLLRYPDVEFSLSDLAKEAGVAKANIGQILQELHEMNLIIVEKLTKIWRIKANMSNPDSIKNKIVYNLNSIYQSGLVEFLNDYYKNPRAIILFGSFRRGEDLSSSDIDIAIENDFQKYELKTLPESPELEKIFGKRKIQIHLLNRKNIDINLFNNIANGIILSGFLEVKI
jgi:predicted nucleotidyltransferase